MVKPENKNYIRNLDTLSFPTSGRLLKTDIIWYFNEIVKVKALMMDIAGYGFCISESY
jgi:hypothetical protein